MLAAALSLVVSQVLLPAVATGEHLMDSATLARRLIESARTREEKIALFQEALDRPAVRQRARSLGVSAGRLERALPHLSDAELADLEARARRAEDVRAGHSSNDGMAVLGIVLLLAAVVVLVAASGYGDGGYYDDCYCY